MAAPFVTGAVGTLSNLYENEDALQIKEKLLKCTRKTPNLKGKVATLESEKKKVEEEVKINGIR